MGKKEDEGINFFIEDANIFSLWVYSRPDFHPREYFCINEITPLQHEDKRVLRFLETRLKMAGVPFGSFVVYNNNDYSKIIMPPSDQAFKKLEQKVQESVLQSYEKLREGALSLKDFNILIPHLYTLPEYFGIQTNFKKGDVLKIRKHIDEYIDLFLNTELFVYDRNYFIFEKQKQIFIEKLKKMSALESYGANFVVSHEVSYGMSEEMRGFLFIHTLYALEKLQYIKVIRLWFHHTDRGYKYFANIIIFNSLIEEVHGVYQKENPTMLFETFDEKKAMVRFAGKEIFLSKKGKKTDAVLLFSSLIKAKVGEWMHNDEIFDDWGYSLDDAKNSAKNKIYFAGQKINNVIALQTGITDFVECFTTKVRINPKYRKVDD